MLALTIHQPWAQLCVTRRRPVDLMERTRDRMHDLGIPAGVAGAERSVDAPPMIKSIETRSWRAPASAIGERIAIHASARVPTPQRGPMFVGDFHIAQGGTWLHGPGDGVLVASVDVRMAFGAVIGSAVLAACVPMHDTCTEPIPDDLVYVTVDGRALYRQQVIGDPWVASNVVSSDVSDQLPYGDFTPGRWAWVLSDAAPCEDRCPACWGDGYREPPTKVPSGMWTWQACPACTAPGGVRGAGWCKPIPARGRQRLWRWEP